MPNSACLPSDANRPVSLGRASRTSSGLVRTGLAGQLVTIGAMLLAVFAFEAQALAQTPAPPTREELQIDARTRIQTAPNRLSVEGDIERGPCPFDDPSFAAVRVNFSTVEFANLPGIPAQALEPAWRDMAGQDLPVASLCQLRDRAATMLRQMGFLAAVQIPPQRIETGGTLRLDILAAKLVEVQLRGSAGNAEKLISAHLAKLTRDQWFNIREAERHLLLLEDLPGFDVRLTLRSAGSAPGEVVGDVAVTRRPIEAVLFAQNLGPKSAGREGLFAQIALNDLTGLGDRTTLSIFNTAQTRERTVFQLTHDFAIGSDGLRLGGSLIYGRGRPDLAAAGNFKTKSLIGRIELSYPLLRRQQLTLAAAGGLEAIDQSVDFGAVRLSKDKLRIAYLRFDLDAVDRDSLVSRGGYSAGEPRWRIGASLEARLGIGGLGASGRCVPLARCRPPNVPISNVAADPSAFLVRLESSLEYRPVPLLTFAVSPRFQYSSKPLLGYEQYSLGNYTVGRGFDPGIVLGDKGAGASAELRAFRLTPGSPDAVAVQPFAFFDAAWAWTNDKGATAGPAHVTSAGGGVRARWGNHLDASLVVAVPLERAGFQTRRGDVRALFTVTARIWPWKR